MDFNESLINYGDAAAFMADELYGDSYEITKSIDAERKRKRSEMIQTRVSQASNVIGLTAGAAAVPPAVKGVKEARYKLKGIKPPTPKVRNYGPKVTRVLERAKNPKVAMGLAAAGLGLQAVNLGGDAITSVVLNRTAKRSQKELAKSDMTEFGMQMEISKIDSDKRQVFGWASISKKDGVMVKDLQGDAIDTDELERAAYQYMLDSRKGGHEHQKTADGPVHVADVIESMVITPEKKKALGLPDSMPEGWWIGMKVHDDKVWELAKSGELAGFSIHGSGRRVPIND